VIDFTFYSNFKELNSLFLILGLFKEETVKSHVDNNLWKRIIQEQKNVEL